MMRNSGGLTLGAGAFGAVYVGPFLPGAFIESVVLGAGTGASASVRIGTFTKPSTQAAAVFASDGEFFSSADMQVIGPAGNNYVIEVPVMHLIASRLYIGVGITTAGAGAFTGGIFVRWFVFGMGGGIIGTAGMGTPAVPLAGIKTAVPVDVLPHSPGFYGWHPGPG